MLYYSTMDEVTLFAETNGCLLVEVTPQDVDSFEAAFKPLAKGNKSPVRKLGVVSNQDALVITQNQSPLINVPLSTLIAAFKRQQLISN